MSAPRFSLRPWTRFTAGAILIMSLARMAPAAEITSPPPRFLAKLSIEEKKALDLAKLSPEQEIALDSYIQRELLLARQGGVLAFNGTFTRRRAPAEREKAGLDQLSPAEREILDTIVARALATPPAYSYRPARATGSGIVQSTPRALEVHGSVTLAVGGASGGRSFYGGEMETTIEDPEHHFALSVGYSEFHFNGGSRYDGFGYGNGCGRGSFRGW